MEVLSLKYIMGAYFGRLFASPFSVSDSKIYFH